MSTGPGSQCSGSIKSYIGGGSASTVGLVSGGNVDTVDWVLKSTLSAGGHRGPQYTRPRGGAR